MQSRKKDHIDLAYKAQMFEQDVSELFDYEPMLASNELKPLPKQKFLGKNLRLPLWVSSMTGGTNEAGNINRNLAKACREFGMGMGLGSCRSLLNSNKRFDEFDIRDIMGDDLPLMANLGVAQVEKLLYAGEADKINHLIQKLRADGLLLHVNPLQELLQPEGDIYKKPPIETLLRLLEEIEFPVIVKEVGQGMGPKSLQAVLDTNVAGIELAAFGGTNFSMIELMRSGNMALDVLDDIAQTGHTAHEMIGFLNEMSDDVLNQKEFIISGGLKPLSAYYLMKQLKVPAIGGMAFQFLKYAREDYALLQQYVGMIKKTYQIAQSFLHTK